MHFMLMQFVVYGSLLSSKNKSQVNLCKSIQHSKGSERLCECKCHRLTQNLRPIMCSKSLRTRLNGKLVYLYMEKEACYISFPFNLCIKSSRRLLIFFFSSLFSEQRIERTSVVTVYKIKSLLRQFSVQPLFTVVDCFLFFSFTSTVISRFILPLK